jgi:hypothetical protein
MTSVKLASNTAGYLHERHSDWESVPGVNTQDRPTTRRDCSVPDPLTESSGLDDNFDYSTPEAEAAIRAAAALVLEIREDQTGPLARKVALYERTLGLAVIPVLLRRAIIARRRRSPLRRRGA